MTKWIEDHSGDRYLSIPTWLACRTDFTPIEKLVYAAVRYFGNTSGHRYPSYQTLADKVGVSRRHTIDVVSELIKKGAIRKITRGDTETNEYVLMKPSSEDQPIKTIVQKETGSKEPSEPQPIDDTYRLKSGRLAGKSIEVLKDNTNARDWYLEESDIDGDIVRKWWDGQIRSMDWLKQLVSAIASPRLHMPRTQFNDRAFAGFKESAERNRLTQAERKWVAAELSKIGKSLPEDVE